MLNFGFQVHENKDVIFFFFFRIQVHGLPESFYTPLGPGFRIPERFKNGFSSGHIEAVRQLDS